VNGVLWGGGLGSCVRASNALTHLSFRKDSSHSQTQPRAFIATFPLSRCRLRPLAVSRLLSTTTTGQYARPRLSAEQSSPNLTSLRACSSHT